MFFASAVYGFNDSLFYSRFVQKNFGSAIIFKASCKPEHEYRQGMQEYSSMTFEGETIFHRQAIPLYLFINYPIHHHSIYQIMNANALFKAKNVVGF